MSIAWPAVLKPIDFGFFLIDAATSGGAAIGTNVEQFVVSPGLRWGAEGSFPIRNAIQVRAARALRVQLKGPAVPVLLPNFDGRRLSWPVDEYGRVLKPAFTRRRTLDGTAYEDPAIPAASEITAEVATDTPSGSTVIGVLLDQGEPPLAGQQFGLGERMYEIGEVFLVTPNLYSLTFSPRLRADADTGDTVKFTRPVCLMRCVNFSAAMRKLNSLRFTTLDLEFVEY